MLHVKFYAFSVAQHVWRTVGVPLLQCRDGAVHVTRGSHPGRRGDEAPLTARLRRERIPDGGLPPVTPSGGKREKYSQVHLSVQSRYVQGRIQDFVKEDRNSGWDRKQVICSILVGKNAKNGNI